MKIRTLINDLQQIEESHGNIEVGINDHRYYSYDIIQIDVGYHTPADLPGAEPLVRLFPGNGLPVPGTNETLGNSTYE